MGPRVVFPSLLPEDCENVDVMITYHRALEASHALITAGYTEEFYPPQVPRRVVPSARYPGALDFEQGAWMWYYITYESYCNFLYDSMAATQVPDVEEPVPCIEFAEKETSAVQSDRGPTADDPGYCYLRLADSAKVSELASFGQAPPLEKLLTAPRSWYGTLHEWSVVGGVSGTCHVVKPSGVGPCGDLSARLFMTTAAFSGGTWPSASLGEWLTQVENPRCLSFKADEKRFLGFPLPTVRWLSVQVGLRQTDEGIGQPSSGQEQPVPGVVQDSMGTLSYRELPVVVVPLEHYLDRGEPSVAFRPDKQHQPGLGYSGRDGLYRSGDGAVEKGVRSSCKRCAAVGVPWQHECLKSGLMPHFPGPGMSYLHMIEPGYCGVVAHGLGPGPTLRELLELPLSCIRRGYGILVDDVDGRMLGVEYQSESWFTGFGWTAHHAGTWAVGTYGRFLAEQYLAGERVGTCLYWLDARFL